MSLRNRKQQGFTLVEILIVVVILGILAAIVIPQFTSASESARASNLVSQLQSIRSQLELYQIQHNGVYPTAAGMDGTNGVAPFIVGNFDNLINATMQNGTIVALGTANSLGPYMQKSPVNPFVTDDATTALPEGSLVSTAVPFVSTATDGWCYNPTTGAIVASLSGTLTAAQITALNFNTLDYQ